jgi:hypothetical protein
MKPAESVHDTGRNNDEYPSGDKGETVTEKSSRLLTGTTTTDCRKRSLSMKVFFYPRLPEMTTTSGFSTCVKV